MSFDDIYPSSTIKHIPKRSTSTESQAIVTKASGLLFVTIRILFVLFGMVRYGLVKFYLEKGLYPTTGSILYRV